MTSKLRLALSITVLLLGSRAQADGGDHESGLSGHLALGGVLHWARTSTFASPGLGLNVSRRSVSSLDREPGARTALLPTIDFDVQYVFSEGAPRLFAATDAGEPLQFETSLVGGIRQPVSTAGTLTLAALTSSGAKVWADPYVVNAPRRATTRTSVGAIAGWDQILGSNLRMQYRFRSTTVRSEASGSGLGLTPAERDLLRRSGETHQVRVGYLFTVARTQWIDALLSCTRQELRGAAMSGSGCDVELRWTYGGGPFMATMSAMAGGGSRDRRNPVFGRQQAEVRYGGAITVLYHLPFNWARSWSAFATEAYAASRSNIQFYSSDVWILGTGAAASF